MQISNKLGNHRLQRNHVTKLKKTSMHVYFFECCAGWPKSKVFWPTINPVLYKKGTFGSSEILLSENEVKKHISDQEYVCEVFYTFLRMWPKILAAQMIHHMTFQHILVS